MNRKVKWGVAGLGNIAHKFTDLIIASNVDLVAVASSSLDRAKEFKNRYGAKKAYGSYDKLFEDKDVEVVYIASLNNHHKKMTLDALNAKKAVLCEKPLGINAAEVNQMIIKSKNQNCFLMEGLWSRFNPAIKIAKKWTNEGQIGIPRFIYAEFSFYRLDVESSHRLMDPLKGGGALLDIGIYPLFSLLHTRNAKKLTKGVGLNWSRHSNLYDIEYDNASAMLYCGITNPSDNSKICVLGRLYYSSVGMKQSVKLIKNSEVIEHELQLMEMDILIR